MIRVVRPTPRWPGSTNGPDETPLYSPLNVIIEFANAIVLTKTLRNILARRTPIRTGVTFVLRRRQSPKLISIVVRFMKSRRTVISLGTLATLIPPVRWTLTVLLTITVSKT